MVVDTRPLFVQKSGNQKAHKIIIVATLVIKSELFFETFTKWIIKPGIYVYVQKSICDYVSSLHGKI